MHSMQVKQGLIGQQPNMIGIWEQHSLMLRYATVSELMLLESFTQFLYNETMAEWLSLG